MSNGLKPNLFKKAPCRGMCIWRSRVIVFYPGKIVVFGNFAGSDQLGDETLSSSQCIRVHYFQAAFDEFFALNYDSYPNANGCQDVLRLILREGSGFVRGLLIQCDEGSEAPGNLVFATTWSRLELPCLENDCDSEATKVVVGPDVGQHYTSQLANAHTICVSGHSNARVYCIWSVYPAFSERDATPI